MSSQQGGLALPGRIALLATAQQQGDTGAGGTGEAIPLFPAERLAKQQGSKEQP